MPLDAILADIAACRACAPYLPHTPRPVTRVREETRILIAARRRAGWSTRPACRSTTRPATGCATGWGSTARPSMAGPRSAWRPWPSAFRAPIPRAATIRRRRAARRCGGRSCWPQLPNVELTLLVGSYAQAWALGDRDGKTMTDTVAAWRDVRAECPADAASVVAQHRLAEAQSVVRGGGRALSSPACRGHSGLHEPPALILTASAAALGACAPLRQRPDLGPWAFAARA
jgi:hypothetical protein